MALPSVEYTPRSPGGSVLYQIVREHFETFRAEAAHLRDGEGLPRFVEEEFEAYLRCGWLAGGFARFRCGCGLDRLVAFSCKGRGFCASCGGRRMTERAAHLVDQVFPDVPVRQWVLSLPPRIRYLLAWRHDLCKAVVGVLFREVNRHLRDRARAQGVVDPCGGAVAIVQRFGGALNLNVHIHALVLDGVFARAEDGRLAFHASPGLEAADVADVLAAITPGVTRLLERRGVGDGDDADRADDCAEATPLLAGLAAASVQGVVALGRRSGMRPGRLGGAPGDRAERPLGACHAQWQGFDLHAGLLVPAGDRDRLERVCRYTLRPPVTDERLRIGADGQVVVQLRHRGRMARRPSCSNRPRSWSAWRCSSRGPESTWCCTTACWRRGRRGAPTWCVGRHQSSPRTPARLRHRCAAPRAVRSRVGLAVGRPDAPGVWL